MKMPYLNIHRPGLTAGITFLLAQLLILTLASPPARAAADDKAAATDRETHISQDWSLHAQATTIFQGYPSFHSSYQGPNSLGAGHQIQNTETATLFAAARLWPGATIFINPEVARGFGLNNTAGIAGFSNGDATKAGSKNPKPYLARYYIQQVIGLGGEKEWVEGAANQLAGYQDINRITLSFGKLGGNDFFDNNSASHDGRTQFMNLAIWESGAWDFAADARGYTYGFVVEYNREAWALRYEALIAPEFRNESALPWHGLNSLSHNVELERRYKIGNRPGKARLLAFYTRARQGNYREALALAASLNIDPNTAIDQTRHYGNEKYGFVVNLEQELTDSLTGFTRLSFNDGKTEDWSFTQIDRGITLGLSQKGTSWARPDDSFGVAEAINQISSAQRDFLAVGGLGLIIGDGALHYGPEAITEVYYNLKFLKVFSLTADYQLVLHPAYNRDRGPVHIFSGRIHFEI
jgi:high affinity Mn2+ porin